MNISKEQFLKLVGLNHNKLHLVEERIGNSDSWRTLGKVNMSLFLVSNFVNADVRPMDGKDVLYMEFDNGFYPERYRIEKSSIEGL